MLRDFFHYQAMFQAYLGLRMYIAYVFAAFASFAEGVGILMLLPLLQQADIGIEQSSALNEGFSFIEQLVVKAIEGLGFEYSLSSILFFVTIAFVLKGFLSFGALSYNARVSALFLTEIRNRLANGYLKMTYSYFTQKDAGYFSNLMNEQSRKSVFANECMASFGATFVNFSLLISFAFFASWKFGAMVIVAGIFIVILFLKLNIFVQDISRQSSKQEVFLTKWMLQALRAFKYLSATGKRELIGARIENLNADVSSFHFKHRLASALTVSLREPIAVVCIVLILSIQAFVLGERLEPLFVSIVLFYRGLNALLGCQASWVAMLGNIGSFEAIDAELKEQANKAESEEKKIQRPSSTKLEFKKIELVYEARDLPIIQNLCFEVSENSTVALVGKSGAGKTSIINMIALLIEPSKGSLLFGGFDSNTVEREFWRNKIGYVSQDIVLFDDTIANNITLWAEDGESVKVVAQMRDAAHKARILDFIEGLPDGFETLVGDNGIQLSGGQRQRVAIARELFKRPALLLLDEATSALDSESEEALQNSLVELRGEMTIVIVAHRLSTIRNVDKIFVVEQGTIVESGSFSALKNNRKSVFNQMINLQRL